MPICTLGCFINNSFYSIIFCSDEIIKRIVMGQVVIDHEEVTRTFPEGTGKIELVAIYEIRDGRIATARFIY